MRMLNFFSKAAPSTLVRLATGCFTVDRNGHLVASTLPQSFPTPQVQEIAKRVLAAFNTARQQNVPLVELMADYSALTLTAREMRGGAIVYLTSRPMSPTD